jgi:histidine triad (HIT) family protein
VPAKSCLFCDIAAGTKPALLVFTDDVCVGFLDHRPLFPGHVLLVPRAHDETLADLPQDVLPRFFSGVQLLAAAVQGGMSAQGSFVAINNQVSQSVPHLHVHIVPRNRGDGLRGFFWPRQSYADAAHMQRVQEAIRAAVRALQGEP